MEVDWWFMGVNAVQTLKCVYVCVIKVNFGFYFSLLQSLFCAKKWKKNPEKNSNCICNATTKTVKEKSNQFTISDECVVWVSSQTRPIEANEFGVISTLEWNWINMD